MGKRDNKYLWAKRFGVVFAGLPRTNCRDSALRGKLCIYSATSGIQYRIKPGIDNYSSSCAVPTGLSNIIVA